MRFEVIHKDKGLAFGTDLCCGSFLMIWLRRAGIRGIVQDRFGPDPGDIIVDIDEKFSKTPLTMENITAIITHHGFTLDEMRVAMVTQKGDE